FHVTGVQTCALPIFRRPARAHWIARAVPHDPAPSTAILSIPLIRLARLRSVRLLAAVAADRRARRRGFGGGGPFDRQPRAVRLHRATLLALLQRLGIKRIEIDRL